MEENLFIDPMSAFSLGEDVADMTVPVEAIPPQKRKFISVSESESEFIMFIDNVTGSRVTETQSQQGSSVSQRSQEVTSLFRPNRCVGVSRPRPKRKQVRTWTSTFVCLADQEADYIPNSSGKTLLQKAGLGQKRIQFTCEDTSEDVHKKLTSSVGFSKLASGGGFEFLTCQSNCRKLSVLTCSWDVATLKSSIGSQTKIYIRPIQYNLDTSPLFIDDNVSTELLQEKCSVCSKYFNMIELRKHVAACKESAVVESTSENEWELPETDILDMPSISEIIDNDYDMTVNGMQTPERVDPIVQVQLSTGQTQSLSNEADIPHSGTLPIGEQIVYVDMPSSNQLHVDVQDEVAMESAGLHQPQQSATHTQDIGQVARACVLFCKTSGITDPTEILRYLQSQIVTGRKIDLESADTTEDGETNFICVDRISLLETAFEEIAAIGDLRNTLEVQFYSESAVDLGGPRKEFFALITHMIMDKYFDPVREFSKDYTVVGKILALSLLQNGKLPKVLSPELVEEVFQSATPRQFVKDLRQGLDYLGLFQIISDLPILSHFFMAGESTKLTLKMLIQLLKPELSPQGSNRRAIENLVYSKFIKYLREAASGRRACDIQSILRFVTGAEEEPCLGFAIHPSIRFVETISFLPTANTCTHRLNLVIPSDGADLPSNDVLYKLFDYSFCNQFYGLQ